MNKVILSFCGSVIMILGTFGFGNILSNNLSWGSIILATVISVFVNSGIVYALRQKGLFYKLPLYTISLYNVLFVLIPGVLVIVVSEKSYIIDAIDVLSPYLTLMIISCIHGLLMSLMIKINKKLV
ncbi:hypothetical protein AAEO50_02125 [Rossellomorea oryzaecorticis]|uniref:Uncharacterized protein n=1 Tax=Rossellomorea oryzaecorticis TaxID=1396505 RepID=A0ABU9K6D8_9BACI